MLRQVKPRPKVQNKNIQAEIIDISSGEDEILRERLIWYTLGLSQSIGLKAFINSHNPTEIIYSDEDLLPGKNTVRRLSRLTINSESESDPEFATPGPFEDRLLSSPVTTSHNSVIDLTISDTDSEDRELCVPRRVNDIRHKVQPLPSKDDLASASRQSPSSVVDNPYIRENGEILILY
ncbi:hypothetical protein PHLCEN_2v971 [Hermanssonia centrifuga]|uniref:Uncharacterized protein n=1 Tax=Hermanssonia centrifuga TaxID=98765 RepID=A0A2R6S4H9_9APHY|nr:hypothetical protein PHLCEN_2v971 [Hermanssonia centrifuga]